MFVSHHNTPTVHIGAWYRASMYIGVAWSVAYLREPWCVSVRRGVLNYSHYPSRFLLPGPSGCWCHCTAAGSPSCQSPSARWCSWCPGWRKTHSTYNSDTETQKHPKSVHAERREDVAWYQKTDPWNVCQPMSGRFSLETEHLFQFHQRPDDALEHTSPTLSLSQPHSCTLGLYAQMTVICKKQLGRYNCQ